MSNFDDTDLKPQTYSKLVDLYLDGVKSSHGLMHMMHSASTATTSGTSSITTTNLESTRIAHFKENAMAFVHVDEFDLCEFWTLPSGTVKAIFKGKKPPVKYHSTILLEDSAGNGYLYTVVGRIGLRMWELEPESTHFPFKQEEIPVGTKLRVVVNGLNKWWFSGAGSNMYGFVDNSTTTDGATSKVTVGIDGSSWTGQ